MVVIGITGNGGVGKTTIASNLGACLAVSGIRTLIIDANLYSPSVGAHFGVQTRYTIHDFVQNSQMGLEWLLYNIHGLKDLYLILGNDIRLPNPNISFRPIGGLIELVREYFGTILVDFPPGLPVSSRSLIDHLDYQILVIDPTVVPRRNLIPWVDELIMKYTTLGKDEMFVVINKPLIAEKDLRRLEGHIEEELGLPLLATIPYEPELIESLHAKTPSPLLETLPEALEILAAEITELFL